VHLINRSLSICLSAALAAIPLAAQRGGHFGGGGAHFSSPLPPFSSTIPSGAGVGVRVPSSTALGGLAGVSTPLSTSAFHSPTGHPSRGFYSGRYPSRGYYGRDYRRYPYALFFTPYYYPFLDYGNAPYYDSYYDAGPGPDPNAEGSFMAMNALGEQVQRLSAELDELRSGGAALQAPPAPPAPSAEAAPTTPPITLVLRDGQQFQVQSYAVMNKTFWDFSNQMTRKIPLSNIDIAASTKATEASGGEFPQLDAGQ